MICGVSLTNDHSFERHSSDLTFDALSLPLAVEMHDLDIVAGGKLAGRNRTNAASLATVKNIKDEVVAGVGSEKEYFDLLSELTGAEPVTLPDGSSWTIQTRNTYQTVQRCATRTRVVAMRRVCLGRILRSHVPLSAISFLNITFTATNDVSHEHARTVATSTTTTRPRALTHSTSPPRTPPASPPPLASVVAAEWVADWFTTEANLESSIEQFTCCGNTIARNVVARIPGSGPGMGEVRRRPTRQVTVV